MKLEVLNAELLSSLAIGAQVLINLRPNGQQLTVDQVCLVRVMQEHLNMVFFSFCNAVAFYSSL